MTRLCPDCRIELERIEHAGVHLDVCSRCAGIWFEEHELRSIQFVVDGMRSLDERIRPGDFEKTRGPYRLCPVCDGPLIRYRYLYTSHVELEGCDSCGGCWVEDGELAAMQEFLIRERAEPATPQERQRLLIGIMAAHREESRSAHKEFQEDMEELSRRPRHPWWIGYGNRS